MKEPIAETVAGPEPEMAAKNMQARTVTMARPPMMNPTRLSARATSRLEIPPLHMSAPARMKNGIANRGKESSPVKDFCAIRTSGMSVVRARQMPVANPSVMPMGMLRPMNRIRSPKRRSASMIRPPLRPGFR